MKLKYRDKVKTFYCDIEANRFLGTHIPGMVYSMITPELYYKFDRLEFWDNGKEMTGEEWATIAEALILCFKKFDMTNEEKSQEIARNDELYGDTDNNSKIEECYIAALSMASWKDEQLANCIESLEKEYIKNSGKGLLSNEEIAAKLATLRRIKEEMK